EFRRVLFRSRPATTWPTSTPRRCTWAPGSGTCGRRSSGPGRPTRPPRTRSRRATTTETGGPDDAVADRLDPLVTLLRGLIPPGAALCGPRLYVTDGR